MLLVALAAYTFYSFVRKAELKKEVHQLKLERAALVIAEGKYIHMIKMLEEENEIWLAKSQHYQDQADSLKKINNEIPNPKDEPIPLPSARNDSIRKWARDF